MIKILFIIPTFRRGGVERITLNILNHLNYKVFDISLIICVQQNNELIGQLNNEIKVIELNKPNVRNALPDIFKIINKEKPSLIFTSFNHLSLPILFYKLIRGKKYKTIVRLNSLPSNKLKSNWRSGIYDSFFAKLINSSDAVISQSHEMTKDILRTYKIDQSKVSTIQNPVDVEHIYKLSNEESTIVFEKNYYNLIAIGSLSEVKGYDLLVEAIYKLKSQGYHNYRLYIVGDNRDAKIDYKDKLKKQINDLQLEDRVFLLGFHKNPYNLLKQSDAFVLSSRKEGFPNVVLEALTLEKPCIVTNCVDLSTFVTPNKGVIVEKNSVDELVRGIIEVIKIEGSASRFSNFDFNNWFKEIFNK